MYKSYHYRKHCSFGTNMDNGGQIFHRRSDLLFGHEKVRRTKAVHGRKFRCHFLYKIPCNHNILGRYHNCLAKALNSTMRIPRIIFLIIDFRYFYNLIARICSDLLGQVLTTLDQLYMSCHHSLGATGATLNTRNASS